MGGLYMRLWRGGGWLRFKVSLSLCVIFIGERMVDWVGLDVIGPKAAEWLQRYTSFDLKSLTFGRSAFMDIERVKVHVARGGYTGEDGFEVWVFFSNHAP